MSAERFEYYAFISYSHADEKIAHWLQHKLETHRLPSHVRPVFRDKTDIGGRNRFLASTHERRVTSTRQHIIHRPWEIRATIIASPTRNNTATTISGTFTTPTRTRLPLARVAAPCLRSHHFLYRRQLSRA